MREEEWTYTTYIKNWINKMDEKGFFAVKKKRRLFLDFLLHITQL